MVGLHAPIDTRESLLKAATEAFVEKGFSGARVDEIARKARANKAMIYYHFGSKEKLYRAVLLHQIGSLHEEIARVAGLEGGPVVRLTAFYAGLGRMFAERPSLPHIMFREMLTGGVHMDAGVARALKGVFDFVAGTIREGIERGQVRPVDPLFVHLTAIAPMMLFSVGRSFRERVLPVAMPEGARPTPEALLAHVQDVLVRTLESGPRASTDRS